MRTRRCLFRFYDESSATLRSDQSQLLIRRALVLKLRVLVPALFVPTAVSGIAIAVLDGTSAGFGFRFVGMLAVLIWIATRVLGDHLHRLMFGERPYGSVEHENARPADRFRPGCAIPV
jgi:hypothetical protein